MNLNGCDSKKWSEIGSLKNVILIPWTKVPDYCGKVEVVGVSLFGVASPKTPLPSSSLTSTERACVFDSRLKSVCK